MKQDKMLVLQIITYSDGATAICTNCKKILAKGPVLIRALISAEQNEYAVKNPRNRICCGKEIAVPWIFNTPEEASSIVNQMLKKIGSTSKKELVLLNRL